jgi:acetate kinase
MGFSPLDGLMMGTRCGSVDASAITYIGENEGMSYAELNAMMNKKSGVLALSELSSDMRDIDDAYDAGNEKAIVARDMYYNRVKKFVGEYAAEMGGVDLLIFTGGVGENSADLRRYVCENMQFMGIEIDESINIKTRGTNTLLSTPEAKVKVAVIATNEELVIATDTYNLTKNL